MKKILFLGNEHYGSSTFNSLLELIDSKKYEVFLGVKKLDKHISKVIKENNFPRSKIKILSSKKEVESYINKINPLVGITASFGIILTKEAIPIPKLRFWNFHPSLLPKYRGPSPLRTVILNGEKESGVTLYCMNEKMDAGDILLQHEIKLKEKDPLSNLVDEVNKATKTFLNEFITNTISKEKINDLTVQDEKKASYCFKIKDSDGLVTFNEQSKELLSKVNALGINPGVFFFLNKKRTFIREASSSSRLLEHKHGTIEIGKKGIFLFLKDGVIEITKLQQEGKKTLYSKDFFNGWKGDNLLSCTEN